MGPDQSRPDLLIQWGQLPVGKEVAPQWALCSGRLTGECLVPTDQFPLLFLDFHLSKLRRD